jgi:hypothetical protein
MYVEIGGIEQWIQIGSTDRDNPILLFLHVGPAVHRDPRRRHGGRGKPISRWSIGTSAAPA